MTTSANNPNPRPRATAAEIQAWLVQQIAERLGVAPDEIDTREQFSAFGLDSRLALALVSKLERWLGHRVPPTLIWNYPTIEALSQRLAEGIPGKES